MLLDQFSGADRRLAIAFVAAACGLALAGCGSSRKATTAAGGSSPGLRFSACMRAHGVPNFPDPSSRGQIAITPGSGLDPFSPAFEAAQKACGGGPGGGGPSEMSESQKLAALAFSKCMRAHGVPNFPDPSYHPSGNGPMLSIRGMLFAPTAAFNPGSPAIRQAAAACGVKLP
jgi:hypothetical protein